MFAKINVRTEESLANIPLEELKEYAVIIAGFKNFKEIASYDSSNSKLT